MVRIDMCLNQENIWALIYEAFGVSLMDYDEYES
jgi:hypothetical protein